MQLQCQHGLVGSMSRKGNCWARFGGHAVMKRFFLNLKLERVWQRDYANHGEAMNDIADYIVSFYNNVRLHSKLGNLSPNAFEQKSAIKQPIGVCENLCQDILAERTALPKRMRQLIPIRTASFRPKKQPPTLCLTRQCRPLEAPKTI